MYIRDISDFLMLLTVPTGGASVLKKQEKNAKCPMGVVSGDFQAATFSNSTFLLLHMHHVLDFLDSGIKYVPLPLAINPLPEQI